MKLGIIGNSHIGSLKRGWDQIAGAYPFTEITFFGARGNLLQYLKIEAGKLVPTREDLRKSIVFTSVGREDIQPDRFDCFLVYATMLKPLLRDERACYSKQTLSLAVEDATKGSVNFKIFSMLRQLTPVQIFVGHTPLPAGQETAVDQSIDAYVEWLEFVNEAIFAKLNARMISQPLETIVNSNRTNIDYSVGSKRLAIGDGIDNQRHPDDDEIHMNDLFGQLWLRKFLAEIAC